METEKITILEKLYALYDQYIAACGIFACKKGCDTCCTCNVTMTSLERSYLLKNMDKIQREKLVEQVKKNISPKRYHPKLTTNGFAAFCASGEEIPEEENDPLWGACPLLSDNICSIYNARPFGCRSLVSEKNCAEKGYAVISELMLTVNNIFMQSIEHVDASGSTGNLSDMILIFDKNATTSIADQQVSVNNPGPEISFSQGDVSHAKGKKHAFHHLRHHLLSNREARVLMIPPEYMQKLRSLLIKINALMMR